MTANSKPETRNPKLFYGWAIVAVACASAYAEVAVFNSVLSIFMRPLGEEFGWSRSSVSLAITLGSILSGVLAPFTGRLVDRWGARLVLVVAGAIMTLCLFSLASVGSLWHFYLAFALGRAMTSGAISLASSVAVSNWFVRRRGRALALVQVTSRGGTATLPALTLTLAQAFGWRAAWAALGAIVLAVAILPAALFVRRRPEDLGLLPDGDSPSALAGSLGRPPGDAPSPPPYQGGVRGGSPDQGGVRGGPSAARRPEYAWTLDEAWRTAAYRILVPVTSLGSMVVGAINLHLVPLYLDRGIPAAAAVGALSTTAVVAVAAALVWGLAAERLPVRYAFFGALLSGAAGVGLLLLTRDVTLAFLSAAVYGLAFGSMRPLINLAWADYFGRLTLGRIQGSAYLLEMVFSAAGPYLAGLAFDLAGSYDPALWLFLVLSLVAAVAVLFITPPHPPNRVPAGRDHRPPP